MIAKILKYVFLSFFMMCNYGVAAAESNKAAPKIAIYEVFHKESPIFKNDIVIPIHAGRALLHSYGVPLLDVMIGDDTGDNISLKNERYAELTVTYWIWKNAKADYVGLVHYRRAFIVDPDKYYFGPYDCRDYLCALGMTYEKISKLLEQYDVIMPKTAILPMTFREYYEMSHIIGDLDVAVKYVKKRYPEMGKTVDEVLEGHEFNSRNMFIMRKDILDKYAEWLFDVLFHIEADISNEEGEQKRSPGFLAERLFTIWIRHQMKTTDYRVGELYIETLR